MAGIDVAELRKRFGLSQPKFAAEFGLDLTTLRNWEQGRRNPDGPAQVLLAVIAHAPNAVRQAVRQATRSAA